MEDHIYRFKIGFARKSINVYLPYLIMMTVYEVSTNDIYACRKVSFEECYAS